MKIFTKMSRGLLILLFALFLGANVYGQTANQYSFTATTDTYSYLTGGTAVSNLLTDGALSSSISLGFTFQFEGTNYTALKASSDGYLSFGTSTSTTFSNNLNTGSSTLRPLIAPLWDDHDGTGGAASYSTTGVSPNRVFTFEWKSWKWNYNAGAGVISYQAKLYETTNAIEFWYKSESGAVNSGSASIGLAGATSGKFLSVQSTTTPAVSSSTETTSISTKPATNTVYRFTPPPPCTGTPTGGTIAATAASQIVCGGVVPAVLASTGITSAMGLTYQWETAADTAFTTPTNVTGTTATTASLTPPATPASFTAPIYYRLKVTCTASGMSGYSNVAAINPPATPAKQAAVASFTATTTSVTVSVTAGSGGYRLIYFNNANSFTAPTDGLSSALPSTATLWANTGQQLVYNSTGTSVTITGLTIGTTYYTQVYEYLRCGTASPYTNYYNTTGNSATVNTATLLSYIPTRATGINYTPVKTVAAGGNALLITNTSTSDDASAQIPATALADFDFKYLGLPVRTLYACTNGFLRVGGSSTTYNNVFTTTSVIAPFFEDLFQPVGGTLAWEMTGTAPNRVLTVEWGNYEIYNYPGPNLNMQVKLYETTNVIECVYGTFQGFDGSNPNGTSTPYGYSYSYGVGLSGASVTTIPAAGEIFALEKEGTTSFTHLGTSIANKGLNKLTQMPECNSKYTFTPGTYTYTAPPSVSAPINDESTGAIVLTPLASIPDNFCGSYYTSFGATPSQQPVATSVSTTLNDDDVWFKFTALSSNTTITVRGSGGYDPVIELFDANLNSISAVNATTLTSAATNMTETIAASGATATVSGNLYYVRVYHAGGGSIATGTANILDGVITGITITNGGTGYVTSFGGSGNVAFPTVTLSGGGGSGGVVSVSGVNSLTTAGTTGPITGMTVNSGGTGYTSAPTVTFAAPNAGLTGEFSIIVNATPDPPANDNCSGAITLEIGTTCDSTLLGIQSTATATASTSSLPNCSGANPDDDVWYKFVAPVAGQTLTFKVAGQAGFRPAIQLINAGATLDCEGTTPNTWTSEVCASATTNGGTATATFSTYVPGNTYLLRVSHYGVGFGTGPDAGKFTLCASMACTTPTTLAATNVRADSATIGWSCNNCGTDYILEYGPSGYTPGTGERAGVRGTAIIITSPTVSPYILTGLAQSKTYDYYIRQSCGGGSLSPNSSVRSFTTLEACPKPTSISTNTVTVTSAKVAWSCTSCGTDPVIIEYGPAGFVPGTGATAGQTGTVVTTTTGSPYTLTDLTGNTSYDVYLRRDCSAASNGLSANTALVNFLTLMPCIDPPASSTTVSTIASACTDETFTLSLGTTYTGFGMAYQWQSSTDGTTWTDIANATSATRSTTQTAQTQYRCVVSCSGGMAINSTPVTVGQKTGILCYCNTSLGGGASASSNIANVAIIGTPFNRNGNSGVADYTSFGADATTPTLVKGETYTFSLTTTGTLNGSMFIDYNQSGTFDEAEFKEVIPITPPSGTDGVAQTITFTVPTTATTGMTGMRVRTRGSSSPNGATDACTDFFSGETHDYLVNIIPSETAGPGTCSPDATVTSSNSGLWLNLADANGNVFASILDNQVMGVITGSYITNTGTIRQASGNNYMDRNMGITAATPPISAVRMRIYFTNAELQTLLTSLNLPSTTPPSALGVTRVPNAACTNVFSGSGAVAATITSGGTSGMTHYIEVSVPSFSGFYINKANLVIPVEFQSINAQARGNVNVVEWTTASEQNVKEFAVERLVDNKTWEVIGTKTAIGGTKPASYTFSDNTPAALNYYRVRSIEATGKDQISKVVAVKRNGSKLVLVKVSPNPTTEGVNIDFSVGKTGKITVSVMDIIGRIVKTETYTTTEGSNIARLDLSNFAQGTYLMTINDGESVVSSRIIKQ